MERQGQAWSSCYSSQSYWCLFYGARKGGIALGLLGGIGTVILAYAFKLPPWKPPVDGMLTIVAVVAASAMLQASGGPDVMQRRPSACCAAIRGTCPYSRRSLPAP